MADAGFLELEEGTEPGSGSTGNHRLYVNTSDKKLYFKKDNGAVVDLLNPGAPVAADVGFTPAGDLISTDVQAAIEELDLEKAPASHVGSTGISEHGVATNVVAGFMSPSDKAKLDTIAAGATVYTDEQAQDAIGAALVDTATIDLEYNDTLGEITADLKDNAVSTNKLQNDSVTTAKIADANVTNSKLAADSVTTAKIVDANVTEAKLADNSVSTNKIQNAAVDDSKIATGINATKIGTGAVDNTEFSYLNGVTSAIQTQLDAKALAARNISTAATSGLSGGGDLSGDRSLALNINGMTAQTERLASADEIAVYDASQAAHRKMTLKQLLGKRSTLIDVAHTESDDFIKDTLGGLTATGAGTGNSTQTGTYGLDTTENAIGVSQTDTGTTSTGRRTLSSGLSNLMATLARYRFGARIALEQLSNGTDTFSIYVGLIDSAIAGDMTNGAYFRYTHSVNGGRWEAVTAKAGVRTATDTGVVADVLYSIFEVEMSEDGSNAKFYINGNLVATNTTNLPIATVAQLFGYGWKIEKSLGTTAANMSADWYYFELERTNAR